MENTELFEAIKGIASEGADLSAIETGLNGLTKDPMSGINDKESATAFIRSNPFLNSAYDSGISKGVDSYKTKFTANELPDLMSSERQKIIAELNPEETKADKVAREFAEYKASQEAIAATGKLEKELITTFDTIKASENGWKAEDMQNFVNMGEKGVEQFVKFNDRVSEIIKVKIEEALKGKYIGSEPEAGDPPEERDNWKGINTEWMS
ncbi:MAG: hypothetical protein GY928_24280 [Colwellia sp.]|nr:hypothetical protein [Colwellia sp.]